jgi:hypothetical protein
MRLKELAQVTMATATLSCLLLTGLLLDVPAVWAVLALAAAEVVALIWIVLLVARLARSPAPLASRPVAAVP